MNEQEYLKDVLFEEVKIIQDIIRRMASNSFLVKGWAVTLVIGTLLLKQANFQAVIAFLPLLMFWYLDAFFLQQERMYRKLFEWVIANRMKSADFLFDMNASRFREDVPSRMRIMLSITLGLFYGGIGMLVILYMLMLSTGILS
jgi:hypothetical protein